MSLKPAAALSSLWPGEMRGVQIGDTPVLLVNIGGQVHAYEDRCAHRGIPFSRGHLEGCLLTCWAHQWQYDLVTGEGQNPRTARLKRLPVHIDHDVILVGVADELAT